MSQTDKHPGEFDPRDPRYQGSPCPPAHHAMDPVSNAAMRPSSRTVLEEMIRDGRRRLTQLEALARALPMELDRFADEALWQILTERRR